MTWFKVDDRFHGHPKALATSLAAIGLWATAGSWSSDHRTGGVVPDHVLPLLARGTTALADELVAAGLWRRTRGGYRFHDWADMNPTKEEAIAATEKKSSGGTLGNHRRWHVEKGITKSDCPFCQDQRASPTDRIPDRITDRASESGPSPPDPSRPVGNKGGENLRAAPDGPPPHRCQQHQHWTGPVPACRACADARRHRDDWHTRHPNGIAPATAAPRPPPVEAVLAATRGPTPDPDRNVTQIRQLRAGLRQPRPQDTTP